MSDRKKTVCLTMIVKNEAHLIIECFDMLSKYITFDYWAINDNGSTDGTQKLIKDYFAKKGIPGVLDETPWRDFAYNRTRAFEVAYKKADYAFVWDADDEIYGEFVMPSNLTADSYKFIFGNENGLRYSRCQLFNNHKKWHYVGVLHEYPACLEDSGPTTDILGNYYFISGRRGARSKDPNKYLKDALILEKAFLDCYEKKDAIYNRYCFYTAQSYNSCNMHEKAIEYYKKVLTLDNWLQEKYFSCIEIYDQYDRLHKNEEGLRFLVEGFRYDRKRVECVYRLVKHYCINQLTDVAFAYYTLIKDYYENDYVKDDISNHLFAKKEEYDFYFPYYMIIVSERTRHFDTCVKMYEMIFRQRYFGAGEWWINNLFHNIQFARDHLPNDISFLESMLSYVDELRKRGCMLKVENYKIIDTIIAKYRPLLITPSPINPAMVTKPLDKGPVRVMLTVTTCKRFDLFEQTMNSILKMWKDIDQVDYFFCVDDNSSVEDRRKMQEMYPFYNYYMKTPDEKGHRESMNIIWNKLDEIKPTYWIHLEDDWVYFKAENYITKSIKLLEKYENQNVHQLVFNRIYGLMMNDMCRIGDKLLEPGVLLHEKKEGVTGPNCAYWPHYSLQPSITRTKVILELGNYNSPNTFFERDYANKYYAKGYQTMFFDSIYSLHIGKQHWETDGKNAYALNQVGQFKVPETNETTIEVISKEPNEPLAGTMRQHLNAFISKIKSGTHFGLIRPSDGEHTILKGDTITNCDSWTFKTGGVLQKQLMEAIQTVDQNLYIGIPCNTCNKPWNCTDAIYNDFIDNFKIPFNQRTYANIVGNSNWKTFTDFIKSYKKGFFLITSGNKATDLPVKERFLIDKFLVNNWDTMGVSETARLMRFIADKKNQLICFSAGPLSKVWIPMCMKANPENMYMDVGASLDVFMKGATNRHYTNPNHPFSKEKCIFKDSRVFEDIEPVEIEPVQINTVKPFVRSKNLVYFCVFHNKDYAELLKILLVTVKFYSKIDTINFLVFTSSDFAPIINKISELLEIPIMMKFFNFSSMQEATCARLHIFEYEDIMEYKKILYLDTDIIIQNNLETVFSMPIEDKIYALDEGTIEHEYHGGWFFDFTTIDKDIPGMNSGILLFQNSESTRTIFNDIRVHINKMNSEKAHMPSCQDQPFINYHIIKNNKQDTVLLKKYALIYCMDPPPPPSSPTDIVICHFVWPIGNANHKKNRMLQHVNHLLNNYTNLLKITEPYVTPNLVGKTYTWGNGKISFANNKLITTWANGTYTWFDKYTLDASWAGYSHILQFNSTYDTYVAVRKGDLEYGAGTLVI